MEKAYEVKALLEMCKADGLDLLENELGVVYKNMKKWIQDSAALSENKIDDVIAPFIGQLDPILLPLIDKVDGQVG